MAAAALAFSFVLRNNRKQILQLFERDRWDDKYTVEVLYVQYYARVFGRLDEIVTVLDSNQSDLNYTG
jgi:hypothetical protein